MRKSTLFITLMLCVLLSSFTIINDNSPTKIGYIYKVRVNVDEHLMERALVKDTDNSIYYSPIIKKKTIIGYEVFFLDEVDEKWLGKKKLDTKINGPSYEMLNDNVTYKVLDDFCSTIISKTENETVTFSKPSGSAKIGSMMGNVVSNAQSKNKLSFSFPHDKLKKVKIVADEYYDIKMDILWGGEKSPTIVMDKEKSPASIKFSIKVLITASNKEGVLLWEKEQVVKDFTTAFNVSEILEDKKGEFFIVKRTPRLIDKYSNEPIGDYVSLTKNEFQDCIKIALDATLSN